MVTAHPNGFCDYAQNDEEATMRETLNMNSETVTPWYRQFWPWFLIALPGCVVVASISMLFVALAHDDSRVHDNYYKEGLAINQQLAADRTALQLDLRAALRFDADGHAALQLSGDIAPPAQLQLQLIHPLDNRRDHTLTFVHLGSRDYATAIAELPQGRWHLELGDPTDTRWRLRGSARLGAGVDIALQAADATP